MSGNVANFSGPKFEHITGESRRGGARRDGGARRGQDGTLPRRFDNRPCFPPDDRKNMFWACLWKHEEIIFYLNRRGSKIRGWLAVDSRFTRRLFVGFSRDERPLFISGWWAVYRRLIVFVNAFHASYVENHKKSKRVGIRAILY